MFRAPDLAGGNVQQKRKILSGGEYNRICQFINGYHGLAIDCEFELRNRFFKDVEPMALTCILQSELFNWSSIFFNEIQIVLKDFNERLDDLNVNFSLNFVYQ